MNPTDAAKKTVHAYPGGSESLAPRIGMSPAMLRNKVNPNDTRHHLTLAEADELMSVTGDFQILHALAANHGFVVMTAGVDKSEADSLLTTVLQANAARGEFHRTLEAALADGKVPPNELRELVSAFLEEQAKDMRVMACIAALSDSQRPAMRVVG